MNNLSLMSRALALFQTVTTIILCIFLLSKLWTINHYDYWNMIRFC